MMIQQSLKDTVLDGPQIAAGLANLLPADVNLVMGPYPVLPDGGLAEVLTTESWKRAVAITNRQLLPLQLPKLSTEPELLTVPDVSVSGPVVNLIKHRLHEVVGHLHAGRLTASGLSHVGEIVKLPAKLWMSPKIAVHLRASELLILEGRRLKGLFHSLIIAGPTDTDVEWNVVGKYGKADEPLLGEMHELIVTRKAHSVRESAAKVAPKAEGTSFASKVDRLRKKYATGMSQKIPKTPK